VTGLTALRTYIFGRDGIFSIKLGAQGDTGFGDGEWSNIKCNIVQNAGKLLILKGLAFSEVVGN
jgi:hypothetical protein